MTSSGPERLVIRAPRLTRIAGWLFVAFGAFLLLGAAVSGDIAGAIPLLVFLLFMVGIGIASITTRAVVDPTGIRYRYLRSRSVPAERILDVTVGPGSGAYYARAALHVHRMDERPLRLLGLQTADTNRGRKRLGCHAHAIKDILRLA